MLKNVKPLYDKVLIKPIESGGEKRKGAVLIADMGDDSSSKYGKVVATGPGRTSEFGTFIPVQAKVGDVAIIPKVGGAVRVEIEGEEYWIAADRDLVALAEYEED